MNDFQAQIIGTIALASLMLHIVQLRYLRRISRNTKRPYR